MFLEPGAQGEAIRPGPYGDIGPESERAQNGTRTKKDFLLVLFIAGDTSRGSLPGSGEPGGRAAVNKKHGTDAGQQGLKTKKGFSFRLNPLFLLVELRGIEPLAS
jgi:hypothetical protein